MSTFRTVPDEPLRAVVVGAGGMGIVWLKAVHDSPDVELVGVVDLDEKAATQGAAEFGNDAKAGSELPAVAAEARANCVIDVTTPAAHLPVTLEALALGLPVLGEKPLAATVAEGLVLAAATALAGELFMVSQSRRYHPYLNTFKAEVDSLGGVGVLTTEFFKAPRFGGYRDAMDHPLLLDMAIHPFDTARWLLDADPVAVLCDEYNPSWSWYAGAAGTSAIFEMDSGQRYVYTGSWCSSGLETSWNGAWRASAAAGSATWDGESRCDTETATGRREELPPTPVHGEGIEGALADFVVALRTGTPPMGRVADNVMSLAMVEAAAEAASTGARVSIDALLERALTEAHALAAAPVIAELKTWTSVRQSLAARR